MWLALWLFLWSDFGMIRPASPPSRRYGGKIADPSRWQSFEPRAGDVVVSTPPKSGTTWTQGILALLMSGDPGVDAALSRKAPWLDVTSAEQDALVAGLNAQSGRRQVKTHTPLDGIPYWPDLRYITVFRHPIDVHFSFRNHVANMRKPVLSDIFQPDPREGFAIFMEGDHRDGASLVSIVDHFHSAIARRHAPNHLSLHYADMKRDLAWAVGHIADHLSIAHPPAVMSDLIAAARFDNMKANADRFALSAGEGFWRKDRGFFHSASSQKWQGILSEADMTAYRKRMSTLLRPAEQSWLENGGGLLAEVFAGGDTQPS